MYHDKQNVSSIKRKINFKDVFYAGHTGRYLISVLALSSLYLLAQIVFQATLLGIASDEEPYGSTLPNCKSNLFCRLFVICFPWNGVHVRIIAKVFFQHFI